MPTPRLAPLALLLALAACGTQDPKELTNEGWAALNSGKAPEAMSHFDAALAQLEPSDAQYLRANIGRFSALAHVDAERCRDEFQAFAQASAAQVGAKDFAAVANELSSAGAFPEAIAVLSRGMETFPEAVSLVELRDDMGRRAETAGDADTLSALQGLGYTGGK